jgi:hypothetical protein
LLAVPFGSNGNASVTLSQSGGGIINSGFDGTTLSFQNKGGVAAKNMLINLVYSGSAGTASGSATGSIVPGGPYEPSLRSPSH